MSDRSVLTRARIRVAATAVFAAFLAVFVRLHHHCLYDDAFIYLRYVRNVGAGCGVRWNCDADPVEGFSSPIQLLLLLLGSALTSKLVLVSQIVGAATMLAVGLVAVAAAAESSRRPRVSAAAALAVAALLGLDHHVLLNAVIGMDSGVSAVLVLVTFRLVDRRSFNLAPIAALASVLGRPEAITFACLLPFFVPPNRRRRVVVRLLLGLGAITLLRYALFRDVLPNTYWAKAGGTSAHARLGAEYLLDFVRAFPIVMLSPLALLERRRRTATAFALTGALVWLASFLRTGGDTFSYSRLAFPLVPMLTVLAVRGSIATTRALQSLQPHRWVAIVPFVLAAGRAAYAHHIPEQHFFANVNAWIATGRYLEKHYAGKTVATVPIGAIGYVSKLHVLDLVGLTDRVIAKGGRSVPPDRLTREWIGHERHHLEHVASVRPDVVVTTKFRDTPWRTLDEASAGFYADWLILRAIKDGSLPYTVADAEIAPGVHWLLFVRRDDSTNVR
ncbi:MAG: hypothetical protein KF850_35970 [Labilithrix sp.]|nr:hypothetical protein [Labilithrix sp.]